LAYPKGARATWWVSEAEFEGCRETVHLLTRLKNAEDVAPAELVKNRLCSTGASLRIRKVGGRRQITDEEGNPVAGVDHGPQEGLGDISDVGLCGDQRAQPEILTPER
jgi:hypothetical protein